MSVQVSFSSNGSNMHFYLRGLSLVCEMLQQTGKNKSILAYKKNQAPVKYIL